MDLLNILLATNLQSFSNTWCIKRIFIFLYTTKNIQKNHLEILIFAYQYNKWTRCCNLREERTQLCQMTGWALHLVSASDESLRATHRFFRSATTRPIGCQWRIDILRVHSGWMCLRWSWFLPRIHPRVLLDCHKRWRPFCRPRHFPSSRLSPRALLCTRYAD